MKCLNLLLKNCHWFVFKSDFGAVLLIFKIGVAICDLFVFIILLVIYYLDDLSLFFPVLRLLYLNFMGSTGLFLDLDVAIRRCQRSSNLLHNLLDITYYIIILSLNSRIIPYWLIVFRKLLHAHWAATLGVFGLAVRSWGPVSTALAWIW